MKKLPPAANLSETPPNLSIVIDYYIKVSFFLSKQTVFAIMKLTISNESNNLIITVDVSESMTLEDFKAYVEAESDIPPNQQVLILNSKGLNGNSSTLQQLGVRSDDLIVLTTSNGISTSASTSAPVGSADSANSDAIDSQIELMRQQFLANPQMKNQLIQSNPQMESILNNPDQFKAVMKDQLQYFQQGGGRDDMSRARQEELRILEQDPDKPENQARILEIIRQEQIDKNMQLAYDIIPESFASVSMLYIKIKVNNYPVQAFVDSGAQQTIISPRLAERVGIDRLIDKRFVGEARGVGSSQILGKIHSVPIRIGDSEIDIPCSFMVIDTSVDLLFGLDMLKRHKCLIDLANNKLVVGSNIETEFLADHEIENNDLLGSSVGNKGQSLGFGGNIFSDSQHSVPNPVASSNESKKKPASSAAADAATKRQNTGSNKYKDEDIQQLMGLGFLRDQVIKALDACQGNLEMAASLLFQ